MGGRGDEGVIVENERVTKDTELVVLYERPFQWHSAFLSRAQLLPDKEFTRLMNKHLVSTFWKWLFNVTCVVNKFPVSKALIGVFIFYLPVRW